MSDNRDPALNSGATTTQSDGFVTRWDVVRRAADEDGSTASNHALEELCRIYRHPIYIALRHKHNCPHHDAEDLAQSFIAWLIHGGYLRRADPAKGRFRTFLLTYLDNFVANHRRKVRAQKRGAGAIHVPAEFPSDTTPNAIEPRDDNTPEMEFDRAWSLATMREALARLRTKFNSEGRGAEFDTLQEFLLRKKGAPMSYGEAAANLGINEVALRQRVSRFARKFRQTLEEMIKPMVAETELDDELSYLWRCFEK